MCVVNQMLISPESNLLRLLITEYAVRSPNLTSVKNTLSARMLEFGLAMRVAKL